MGDTEAKLARLRARVLWLSAKLKFQRGNYKARFTKEQVDNILELNADTRHNELAAVIAALPSDSGPAIGLDGEVTIENTAHGRRPDESEVRTVANYWCESTGRVARSLTPARLGIIRARLREGWTVEQLKAAVDACLGSDWHTGANPNGAVYTDCSHIFPVEKLERWLSTEKVTDERQDAIERAVAETMRRRRRSI